MSQAEAMVLFPTALVGSFPQPDWLIDRPRLAHRFPPRVRAKDLWRVDPEFLAEAQRDATLLAIRAQEDGGLDIVTDGEIRRESYSNAFATALDGVDIDNPGTAPGFPARPHQPHRQDHRARPVHHVPAGTTAVHLCFGYAAIIHDRPSGYSFLPELAACSRRSRSPSRPPSPAWTARCSPNWRARPSSWAG
jgi:hypothetical protein